MRKKLRPVAACLLLAAFVWGGALIADRKQLREELIRLHVVAASDRTEDQALKLQVRDAVTESLQTDLQNLTDKDAAKAYLQENLPKIEALANRVLRELGCGDVARVSLAVEEFSHRVYDTFTLPAGVYDTLRITIGEGAGKNWWCVVFPGLCMGATAEEFDEIAAGAGFSPELTAALEGKEGYEIRFYILELLGRLENLLHRG